MSGGGIIIVAGGGVALIGMQLIPLLANLFN